MYRSARIGQDEADPGIGKFVLASWVCIVGCAAAWVCGQYFRMWREQRCHATALAELDDALHNQALLSAASEGAASSAVDHDTGNLRRSDASWGAEGWRPPRFHVTGADLSCMPEATVREPSYAEVPVAARGSDLGGADHSHCGGEPSEVVVAPEAFRLTDLGIVLPGEYGPPARL
jgi:hypothetical protein